MERSNKNSIGGDCLRWAARHDHGVGMTETDRERAHSEILCCQCVHSQITEYAKNKALKQAADAVRPILAEIHGYADRQEQAGASWQLAYKEGATAMGARLKARIEKGEFNE